MTKAALRKKYRENRLQLSQQQKDKFTDLILINFQKVPLPFIDCVHTYIASGLLNEIDTRHIIRYLRFVNPGLRISIPKINFDTGELDHYVFHDEISMVINQFGIAEPVEGDKVHVTDIDLVLIPLLAFDRNGYRVGYGKGFYDKFLGQCRPDVIRIGLSFFEPEEQIEDISHYDIPLNYCVTPTGVFSF
ncbi:MAG: 5-formyltetrahydrofolate cyclo-ligase [Ginsengibacter sp.]